MLWCSRAGPTAALAAGPARGRTSPEQPAPEQQLAAIDSTALIATVLQGSDLNPDDIEEVTAFQSCFQTP